MKLLGLTFVGTVNVPATTNGDNVANTKTFAIGGGDWSIEAYDIDGNVLKEFVGSNGTRPDEEATDLWSEFREWCDKIVAPAHKRKQYKAPDGTINNYTYFKKEAMNGRLHGLVASF